MGVFSVVHRGVFSQVHFLFRTVFCSLAAVYPLCLFGWIPHFGRFAWLLLSALHAQMLVFLAWEHRYTGQPRLINSTCCFDGKIPEPRLASLFQSCRVRARYYFIINNRCLYPTIISWFILKSSPNRVFAVFPSCTVQRRRILSIHRNWRMIWLFIVRNLISTLFWRDPEIHQNGVRCSPIVSGQW